MDVKMFIEQFKILPKFKQDEIRLLLDINSKDDINNVKFYKEIREKRFANKKVCTHCGSISIKKHGKTGKNKEKQRYMCKDCGGTFNDTTASPLAYTKTSLQNGVTS